MCFLTAKSTKNSRHKSRKSFKALARELLCNITHPPSPCRSCLNVSISGTTELAFHAQASTLFSTAQTSAVQFPLLKLTLTLAQHHADFLKKIPCANKTSVHVGADRCVCPTIVNRSTLHINRLPQFLSFRLLSFILF